MATHRTIEDRKYCTCCGNLAGCDCFGQSTQKRRIKEQDTRIAELEAERDNVNGVAHIWKKSTERARALLDTMGKCTDCFHPWSLHADEHGCEHEQGDRDGVALPPCQCEQTPGKEMDELSEVITKIERERDTLRAALEKIRKTPVIPFPDPGAHSERVFSDALQNAWSRIQQIAAKALADPAAKTAEERK